MIDFDPDFATPSGWARLYRDRGVQVVPCKDKRPMLKAWKEYQSALVPQPQFDAWYGAGGAYAGHYDMGMLTGEASGRVLMIDLDVYKTPEAGRWWSGVINVHNNGMDPETWRQATGGGGRQMFFTYPPNWKFAVNAKTAIGVDIRCQGGFAVLPPTLHASGANYAWVDGFAPWDLEIMPAPDWLLEEVEKLVRVHGGVSHETNGGHAQARPTMPNDAQYDAFGHQTDGRETKMRDLVWGAVVDWYRECPIKPGDTESWTRADEKYRIYEAQVSPQGPYAGGMTKTQLLDREGRGPGEFRRKWAYAMSLWDTKVAEEASRPGKSGNYRATFDYTDEFKAEAKSVGPDGQPASLILTAEQFLAGFRPPDYIVDGMIQRSYLVSLTARTGHGKTAIAMLLGACVARGVPFHGKPTEQGGVLFFAGENPDDIRARYLALADHEGFDPEKVPFHFVDGVINIQTSLAQLRAEAEKVPNLSLVMVDTQAAYFLGDEGNSNEQQGWFARLLRELIKLPGKPTVLVNCHPTKNATQDNLVPMGGSAFINEVDANLTLWADDKTCTLGPHADKWRGVTFEGVAFELRTVVCERLKDTKGRPMPSVLAVPITEAGAERRAAVAEEDEKTVLRLFHTEKNASLATIARRAAWFWPDGSPAKNKVQRMVDKMVKGKLLYRVHGGKHRLTKAGCRVIDVKFSRDDDDE